MGLLGLIVILLLLAWITAQNLKPDYDGKEALPHLEESVEVYFDAYGIPHIYANSEEDAMRALGYVHAQDRLWQMELLRRIGQGRLSEVFGRDMLDADRLFLSLGIDQNSIETIKNLDRNARSVQMAEAYLDGINTFVDEGPTPIEFYLTGIEKRHFEIRDVLNTMGYMAYTFATAHRTDPLMTALSEKLDSLYLVDLGMEDGMHPTRIPSHQPSAADKIAMQVSKALSGLPVPQFHGSNSWVIGPSKTKSGKVILANDPHIGFSSPAVWYEAHLVAPGFEKYGFHLAGVPFPLLAHNRQAAYGLTMFLNDDTDFYFETLHPEDSSRYKVPGGWASFGEQEVTIPVKDSTEVKYTYRTTRHGPVVNGISEKLQDQRPVSMAWKYLDGQNELIEVLYNMSRANSIEQFRLALPDLHAPGLNIMYGDAEGNVAWWATAQLYEMDASANTRMILDGSSGVQDPGTDIEFSKNPQSVNPPWGYVYSANNQPDSKDSTFYRGYYLPENRARRIVNLLEARNDWDREAVSTMILDHTSPVDPEVVRKLFSITDPDSLADRELKILDILGKWQGDYPGESTAATIYHRWIYELFRHTLQDEMGDELFEGFLSTNISKKLLPAFLEKENSLWWDKVGTDSIETRRDIVELSLKDAIDRMEKDFGPDPAGWAWDKVHLLEHPHPMGQVPSLRGFFNVGPFPVAGSREVINNMAFAYDGDGEYKVTAGPSTRRIIDFSDIENSMGILPTGQSGNPLSPHYRDQSEMFVRGEFRKMMLNPEEIRKEASDVLLLSPTVDN